MYLYVCIYFWLCYRSIYSSTNTMRRKMKRQQPQRHWQSRKRRTAAAMKQIETKKLNAKRLSMANDYKKKSIAANAFVCEFVSLEVSISFYFTLVYLAVLFADLFLIAAIIFSLIGFNSFLSQASSMRDRPFRLFWLHLSLNFDLFSRNARFFFCLSLSCVCALFLRFHFSVALWFVGILFLFWIFNFILMRSTKGTIQYI